MSCCNNYEIFKDQKTPINEPLRGIYKKSFGYISLYRRMPDLFAQVIKYLEKQKEKQNMQNAIDDMKILLNEIINNKPLRKIDGTFNLAILWNQILDEKLKVESSVTWFESEWLFTENYMYIRINEVFEKTSTLKNFDPFESLKLNAFKESKSSMIALGEFISSKLANLNIQNYEIKALFEQILKISLWGNRCDLSLSAGKSTTISEDPSKAIKLLDKYLITNKSDEIWEILQKTENKTKQIDIILDNSAYELFTDLCFADFLLTFNLADTIVFHGKAIPWYVSDVTKPDFETTLYYLENKCSSSILNNLGRKWAHYYKNEKFIFKCEDFWTLPFPYSYMTLKDSNLYQLLSYSQLLIFKGDLNYRKLIGDINWVPTTNFKEALCEFLPTAVVALRTMKCDCISGLPLDYEKKILEEDKHNWLITGNYGTIQLAF
ncbi:damage-control phosphatase ARMT1-like [Daktulosphaira vitifoliae]|uniref:damage-control phosphatase ARMT1-like n=1 Tax=Daktulosphaira vitifoliae TaxID=58002 RepID=UPI0021AA4BB3|nr:damage-control phosphatase ARMT1-like [Daktulosphaira vitifoliae]